MATSVYLTCLEKLYKKIYFKEYHFVEQSLYKLKAEEAKTGSILTAVKTVNILIVESLSLMAYLSPLADPFFSNSFFSQLPDLLFYNTL